MKNQSGRLRQMILIIALIVLQIGQVWAQSEIVVEDLSSQKIQTIKGKVTSGTDNQPLPGVNVIIKGTLKGVITDADGSYQITAASNSTLVFSFIGFLPQEITVQGKNAIDVTLMENISQLNEVVVTALNINRTKNSLGYSVTSIKGDYGSSLNLIIGSFVALNIQIQYNLDKLPQITIAHQTIKN